MNFNDDFPLMMEREAGMRSDVPPVGVAFGLHPVLDRGKSDVAGHDVYKDVEFIKIVVPGDRKSEFFQPADASHRRRFPQAYAAFKQRETNPTEGMPIQNWAPISRSMAMTLKALNVDTVEALAAVHDGHVDKIGTNGRELREKARAWLEDAKSGAATAKVAAEKQALQDQIASLQAQVAAIQAVHGGKAQAPAPTAPITDPTADVEADVAAAARRPRRSAA